MHTARRSAVALAVIMLMLVTWQAATEIEDGLIAAERGGWNRGDHRRRRSAPVLARAAVRRAGSWPRSARATGPEP
jgi:hypothetical protein